MGGQPDYTGSCMIALYPPPEVAGALAVPGGLEPDDMHVTIAYTGDARDVDPEALAAAAKGLADRPPFTAMISGHARFTGGAQDCIVALADAPQLEQLRTDARAGLASQGISIPSEHGYTPHLTIQYLGEDEADPVGRLAAFPVRFTAVSAVHGKDRTDFPLAGDPPLEQLAAEAYLAGWTLSGGPITERTTPGCAAAIAAALEHRRDPRVLEVTLQIGKLEGAWARVFDRREKLIADHTSKIEALWRKLAKPLDAGQMVRSFRQQAGMTRETAADDHWRDVLRAEAIAAMTGLLNGIRSGTEFQELVAAIELALIAGQAEGMTAALAVAAEMAGKDGFGWDSAYDDMYASIQDTMDDLSGLAEEQVQNLIAGNAADAGRSLASLAQNGATYHEMLDSVMALIAGPVIRAIQALIDYAISGAAAKGALGLYSSGNVPLIAWLTAGDQWVCRSCERKEEEGPYPPEEFPMCPAHPRCRCVPAPASGPGLPPQAYSRFLYA